MDKENAVQADLQNPKKRARTMKPTAPPRIGSRSKVQPSQVLSPKSSNSRTLPQSPIRPTMPTAHSNLAHPTSPLKTALPVTSTTTTLAGMVEKAKTTRAPSGRKTKPAKPPATVPDVSTASRAMPPPSRRPTVAKRIISHGSEASDATTGTVVTAAKGAKRPAGKSKVLGLGTAGRKPAIIPKEDVVPSTATRRVLRKRI